MTEINLTIARIIEEKRLYYIYEDTLCYICRKYKNCYCLATTLEKFDLNRDNEMELKQITKGSVQFDQSQQKL